MKRNAVFAVVLLALALAAGAPFLQAQATFKIPFKFESGGKKLPAGDYTVTRTGEGQLTFLQASNGKETQIPCAGKLAQPVPPVAEPRLVFDEVGAFEPSYTEYFTIYVLAEAWLPGEEGLLVHTTKGAHKSKTVNGEPVKK